MGRASGTAERREIDSVRADSGRGSTSGKRFYTTQPSLVTSDDYNLPRRAQVLVSDVS